MAESPEDQAARERLDRALAESNEAYRQAAANLQKHIDQKKEN
jgi:hypothetical protein